MGPSASPWRANTDMFESEFSAQLDPSRGTRGRGAD